MSTSFDQVFQAAMALPDVDRVQLVESMIDSLPADQEVPLDDAWRAEIARRTAEIDAGTAELVPWEEVRRHATSQLKNNG